MSADISPYLFIDKSYFSSYQRKFGIATMTLRIILP